MGFRMHAPGVNRRSETTMETGCIADIWLCGEGESKFRQPTTIPLEYSFSLPTRGRSWGGVQPVSGQILKLKFDRQIHLTIYILNFTFFGQQWICLPLILLILKGRFARIFHILLDEAAQDLKITGCKPETIFKPYGKG